jgi:hypothetical protein
MFDEDANECQEDSCEASKECKETMLKAEDRKLPCFGKQAPEGYEPGNFACETSCKKKDACIEAQSSTAIKTSIKVAKTVPIIEPEIIESIVETAVKETVKPILKEVPITEPIKPELKPVIKEEVPITEPSTVEIAKVSTPKPITEDKAIRPSKKESVRHAIRSLKKFTQEDLVQSIVDDKHIDDTPEERKKAKGLVSMWLSEFKREGTFDLEKDSDGYYNLK